MREEEILHQEDVEAVIDEELEKQGSSGPVPNVNEVVLTQTAQVINNGQGYTAIIFPSQIDVGNLGITADESGIITAPLGPYKVRVYANFGMDLTDGDTHAVRFSDGLDAEDSFFTYDSVGEQNEFMHTFQTYFSSGQPVLYVKNLASDPVTVYIELHLRPMFEI